MTTTAERAEALTMLREFVSPGDHLYTILRHVSRSGMLRIVQVVTFYDGRPVWLGWNVARAIGATYDRDREGVKVGGCGMDVGFEVVYNLGRALWPDGGPCTGPDCHSNDHSNGDRDYTPGRIHRDGGYTLRQSWL